MVLLYFYYKINGSDYKINGSEFAARVFFLNYKLFCFAV